MHRSKSSRSDTGVRRWAIEPCARCTQTCRGATVPHIILENVPNWRTLHQGKYLREVVATLERLGYKWAYRTVDALAFGLPQRRLRMFLYATLEGDPRDVLFHGDVAPIENVFKLADRAHGFYWRTVVSVGARTVSPP